jgi:hypothetical protein
LEIDRPCPDQEQSAEFEDRGAVWRDLGADH